MLNRSLELRSSVNSKTLSIMSKMQSINKQQNALANSGTWDMNSAQLSLLASSQDWQA